MSFANSLLIAGGGGGASGHGGGATNRGSQGGAGGAATSESGFSSYLTPSVNYASQTQSYIQSVFGTPVQQGGPLAGQDAGNGVTYDAGGNNCAGGGGDGYYGGGASNNLHQGGGGGSGYFNPTYVTGGSIQSNPSGVNTPNIASLNPPQTASAYYQAGIGVGNKFAAGGNGLVVLVY